MAGEAIAHGVDLIQVVGLLAAGVVAVPIFRRLGLGSVLGYLAAGLAIGPFGLRLVSDPHAIFGAAQFGVVMFLFIIGLEMEPSRLWNLRKQIFGLGLIQVLASATVLKVAYEIGHRTNGEPNGDAFLLDSLRQYVSGNRIPTGIKCVPRHAATLGFCHFGEHRSAQLHSIHQPWKKYMSVDAFAFDMRRNPETALVDVAPVIDRDVRWNGFQNRGVSAAPTGGWHAACVEDQTSAGI